MEPRGFDVLIIGAGPAGMTAALYGQRLGLRTVAFGDIPGGNLYMVERLSNFPGFVDGISGIELGVKIFQQAQNEGAHFTMTRLGRLEYAQKRFHGIADGGRRYTATTAIIATGRVPIRLSSQKADLKGVNFCSVCDGPLYRNQNATLAVVGSDNAAAQHAITLARIAKQVFLVYRSPDPKMDAGHRALLDRQQNIVVLDRTEVVDLNGLDQVDGLIVQPHQGQRYDIPIAAVFLAVGWRPSTDSIDFPIEKTSDGYLKTDSTLMTSVPGLFAAGDVRDTDLWQVLTACADGARAAKSAADYLTQAGDGTGQG